MQWKKHLNKYNRERLFRQDEKYIISFSEILYENNNRIATKKTRY